MAKYGPRDKASKAMMLAATCIVIAALYLAQEVLLPLALGILFTFLLAPLVRFLERRRVPRVPAVMIVVIAVFLAFGLLGYVVGGQIVDLAGSLDQYKGNIIAKLERLEPHGGLWAKLTQTTQEIETKLQKPATTQSTQPAEVAANVVAGETNTPRTVTEQSQGAVPNPATQPTKENPLPVAVVQPRPSPIQTLSKYLGLILGPLGTAGVVVVFVIFMLISREDLRDRMIRLVGYGQLHLTTRAVDDAAGRISRYLSAQAMINGVYGCCIALGLLLIGFTLGNHAFPNVILWGLLCAVMRFVPYIGPWIAASFPFMIAFAVYPGFGVFFAVVALFVVVEAVTYNVFEPWLYGSSTGMSTLAIVVSAVFWTWLWGPVGLVLSTPMTVCLVVMGKYVPQLGFLDVLLGDEPVLEPRERVYQRLLAMDQEEAAELAREYVDTMPVEDIYDQVLVPVLAMAEQDRHNGQLDEEREAFILDAMGEITEEVMEQNRVKLVAAQAAVAEARAKETQAGEKDREAVQRESKTALPKDAEISVVLLPAHDQADEIVCHMIANALSLRGYKPTVVGVEALASEMIATVEKQAPGMVVVSALPPAAVTHARYLCKRLHARFPDIETVVGLWLWKGDPERAKARIACTRSVRLVTTLCQALDQIHQAAQHLLVKQEPD